MKLLYLHHIPLDKESANVIQVLQMCSAIQAQGIETTLAVPIPKGVSASDITSIIRRKIGREPVFRVESFAQPTIARKGTRIGAYWGIKNMLRERRYDFCFSRSVLTNRIALKYGLKVICESHQSTLHSNGLLNCLYHHILIKDANTANQLLFIAISESLAEYWRNKGIPEKKIIVLHDGFPAEDYRVAVSQNEAREAIGIGKERKVIVYAGSLYRDRGIENILNLSDRFRDAVFYVLGGPDEAKKYYENKTGEMGLRNIFFTGYIPHYQVKTYLYAADILLMLWSKSVPTINICSPLKVFEYMAAGRIIVGHGFPTIREILEDGKTALLSDPDSFHELQEKLGYALNLGYSNAMAERARAVAFNNYSWEKRARLLVDSLVRAL